MGISVTTTDSGEFCDKCEQMALEMAANSVTVATAAERERWLAQLQCIRDALVNGDHETAMEIIDAAAIREVKE